MVAQVANSTLASWGPCVKPVCRHLPHDPLSRLQNTIKTLSKFCGQELRCFRVRYTHEFGEAAGIPTVNNAFAHRYSRNQRRP